MRIKKPFIIIAGVFAVAVLSAAATLPQQQREEPKLVNLKVFPKNIPYRVLDHTMDAWSASLGVRCNFCHERNAQTGKMDFASDAKPEKTAARHMFLMTGRSTRNFLRLKKIRSG